MQNMPRYFNTVLITVLIAISIIRIAMTYDVFYHTADERAHIAVGMEWLQKGTYEVEDLHPPLARVFAAFPLYINGYEILDKYYNAKCPETFLEHHNRIKESDIRGYFPSRCSSLMDKEMLFRYDYDEALRLARIGILPFFIFTIIFVYLLGRELHSSKIGLLSAFFVSSMPVILGHSGLATTDMALVCTFTMSIYAWILWLKKPNLKYTIFLSFASALAVLSKLTAFLFLPPSLLLVALLYRKHLNKGHIKYLLLSGLLVILVLWGGYRFSLGTAEETFPGLKEMNLSPAIVQSKIIPFPELITGAIGANQKNDKGHAVFVLGKKLNGRGVWYFFPTGFLFKTPIAFLLLTCIGTFWLVKNRSREFLIISILIPILVVLLVMPSNVNIGIRHILPIFPFLAIVASFGVAQLMQLKRGGQTLLVILVCWYVMSSVQVHPDYIAYFNEFAGDHPEDILIDSDLDWGQDRKRLITHINENNIKDITICGFSGIAFRYFMVKAEHKCPQEPVDGWFAVRMNSLKATHSEQLQWLNSFEAKKKIGKSILLYYITR